MAVGPGLNDNLTFHTSMLAGSGHVETELHHGRPDVLLALPHILLHVITLLLVHVIHVVRTANPCFELSVPLATVSDLQTPVWWPTNVRDHCTGPHECFRFC